MPRSKNKLICKICNRELSASVFSRHILIYHREKLDDIGKFYDQKKEELKDRRCTCGKELELPIKLFNYCLMIICSNKDELEIRNILRESACENKYCSLKCSRSSSKIWNKGLTKETHPSLLRISEGRRGKNNPIYKILDDKEKKKKWIENVIEGRKEYDLWKKGKNYEELYGDKEKVEEIKNKLSIAIHKAAHNRGHYPHQGHKHSEKTKNKCRESAINTLNKIKNKVISEPQRILYEELNKKYKCELEYNMKYYSIDIAILNKKIAIEVDGDFYHCNKEVGYEEKYTIQKRNLSNDRKKNTFLSNKGWKVIRIWENDINNNLENVLIKLEEEINE